MPRSYWRVIVAAVGCLTLANNPTQHQGHQPGGRYHQQAAPSAKPKPANSDDHQTTDKGCKGTSRPNLSCEAISAKASEDQAADANAGFWLGIVQSFIGALTLGAAAAAAIFAWSAAAETRRGAIAAEQSLALSKQTWTIENRPIFRLDRTIKSLPYANNNHAWTKTGIIKITGVWKNVGKMPAVVVGHINYCTPVNYSLDRSGTEIFLNGIKMQDDGYEVVVTDGEPSYIGGEVIISHLNVRESDLWTPMSVMCVFGVRYKPAIGDGQIWESWRLFMLQPKILGLDEFGLEGWWEGPLVEPFSQWNKMS